MECNREKADGGKPLREISGTGLGVLCDKCSVAPAITVGEENMRVHINQGGTAEISVPYGIEVLAVFYGMVMPKRQRICMAHD